MYLTREDIVEVLKHMKSFENDLNNVYQSRDYNFRDNMGRRNALMSIAQEREVAKVLRKKFDNVVEDGAPGKPDIFIDDTQTELECKLTSGSKSKGSRVYALQTDWETLCNKESLDYLYIIANKEFDKFCVLFFEGLTSDDFFPPSNGSRGKSRMNKSKGMAKATCLVGDFFNHNEKYINKIASETIEEFTSHQKKMRDLWIKYDSIPVNSKVDAKTKMLIAQNKESESHRKKIKILKDRKDYWEFGSKRYRFILEDV